VASPSGGVVICGVSGKKYRSGTQLTRRKAEGPPLLQVSLSYRCPNCPGKEPPLSLLGPSARRGGWWKLMGWDLGDAEASGGCWGSSLAGEPQPGRLWEATGGLFATRYIFNGRAASLMIYLTKPGH